MMASLVALEPTLPRAAVPNAFDAAFADFLRIDVASGDASPDTVRSYRSEVAIWVAWCIEQGFDAATKWLTDTKLSADEIERFGKRLIAQQQARGHVDADPATGRELRVAWWKGRRPAAGSRPCPTRPARRRPRG